MKDPRTWNRREFSVTPNGYFTVLKPTGWFSAVPLTGGFRYQLGLPKGATFPQAHENPAAAPASASVPGQMAPGHAGSQQTTIRLQTIESTMPDRRLMRPALIVLVATALTWILLWCTAHP